MKKILGLVSLLITCTGFAQQTDTAEVYASYKDRVIQIQVIDILADSKAGIGSGFFAGDEGWIVSNYHVISELVNEPGKYQARYLAENGDEGELTLLAVDPVHDLAILKSDGYRATPLTVAEDSPPNGSRLYSMGYPYDIGLTIVEGTFNGLLEKSLYEKLHFTGSINPGMSGGPTVDAEGNVIGVNVSTAGNQVSFLVPAKHVAALIAGSSNDAPDEQALNRQVSAQLLENQARISEQLLDQELPTTQINGYSVPSQLANYLNCWGNSQKEDEDVLTMIYYRCQTDDDIYLSGSMGTGIIRYQHDLIRTDTLGSMRFYQRLENLSHYPKLRLNGDEKSVSNYACEADFVDQAGLPLKVTYCVRRYKKFEGLYDVYLSATSLVAEQEALQSTLILAGFSWENVNQLSRHFLEAFSWEQ